VKKGTGGTSSPWEKKDRVSNRANQMAMKKKGKRKCLFPGGKGRTRQAFHQTWLRPFPAGGAKKKEGGMCSCCVKIEGSPSAGETFPPSLKKKEGVFCAPKGGGRKVTN